MGKLGENEDEEEEPATERRREFRDLRLDLGEREEQVACHASALTLTMSDKARRKAKKALRLSLTTSSTLADYQTLGWRLMRSKGTKNMAAFSAREVKRVAAESK